MKKRMIRPFPAQYRLKCPGVFFIIAAFCILPMVCFPEEQQLVITPDMQFSYADELFGKDDFQTAMVEFKRFIHFFKDDDRLKEASFKTGICLFKLKQFHESARVFDDIIRLEPQDAITAESVFMQSRAFEEMGNFGYAQLVLKNYLMLADKGPVKDRLLFHLARIQLDLVKNSDKNSEPGGSLAMVRDYLSEISADGAVQYDIAPMLRAIEKAEKAKKKNPVLAGILSIVPGAGFVYCGRYKDGIAAFLFNAGLIYAAYEAFENNGPALGTLIGVVESGFYSGNIYGAVSSAHKYNANQTRTLLNSGMSHRHVIDVVNKSYGLQFNYLF